MITEVREELMNFKHIVKLKTKTMVNSIAIMEGYKPIQIVSPLEVVEDEQ